MRPSETEPKLKIYITAIDETREKALHKEQKIKAGDMVFARNFKGKIELLCW